MNSIDVSLPDPLKTYLDEQVARRGFRDASDFLRSLLEADRHRQFHSELETMLTEAIDGPFSDWTDDDLNDIRQFGSALINRRKQA